MNCTITLLILSLLTVFCGGVYSIYIHKTPGKAKRIFSSVQFLTLSVFFGLLFLFLPVNHANAALNNSSSFLYYGKLLFISAQESLRVFILDGGYKDTIEDLARLNLSAGWLNAYSIYLVFLYFIAPILTFSNVLSLFESFTGELRLFKNWFSPLYIMSDLNDRSVSLASSIVEKYKTDRHACYSAKDIPVWKRKKEFLKTHPYAILKKPVIIFTDVFEKDEESNYDLKTRARDINAICLKKDITGISLKMHLGRIEFFIIGSDESENLSQVIRLTERFKIVKKSFYKSIKNGRIYAFIEKRKFFKKIQKGSGYHRLINSTVFRALRNDDPFVDGEEPSRILLDLFRLQFLRLHRSVSIFLYSNNANSAVVLDSIDKGDLTLSQNIRFAIESNPKQFLMDTDALISGKRIDEGFYLRRIDAFEDLAINSLQNPELIANCFQQLEQQHRFCVLLVGLGEHGMVFLKTLLWLYQLYKVDLVVNIIDTRSRQDVLEQLGYVMPGVIVNSLENGQYDSIVSPFDEDDCSYTINLFAGIDSFSKRYTDLFKKDSKDADSLRVFNLIKRTQLLLVALGDDEKNIECSIRTRILFDQLLGYTKKDISTRVFQRQTNANGEEVVTLNNEYEKPVILSIVYDEKKTENLSAAAGGLGIADIKSTPYHIHFIGNLSGMYSYERVCEMKNLEMDAVHYHIDWIKNECILRRSYNSQEPGEMEKLTYFRKMLLEERGVISSDVDEISASNAAAEALAVDAGVQNADAGAPNAAAGAPNVDASAPNVDATVSNIDNGKEPKKPRYIIPDDHWNDNNYYFKVNEKKRDFDRPDVKALIQEMEKFTRVEYFRRSSIAKAIHKRMISRCFEEYFTVLEEQIAQQRAQQISEDQEWSIFVQNYNHPCYLPEGILVCDCVQCTTKRISEHMRWNMYMRTRGYVGADYRNDRAKVHNDIKPWHELMLSEQYKD